MNNRNSFDNLNDYWLNFLRDDCCYSNDIYILGNYSTYSSAPLTQVEEINEMIKFSQINANYIEIGNKSKNELNHLIDELILQTIENEKKSSKTGGDCKGGSMKIDKCILY